MRKLQVQRETQCTWEEIQMAIDANPRGDSERHKYRYCALPQLDEVAKLAYAAFGAAATALFEGVVQ